MAVRAEKCGQESGAAEERMEDAHALPDACDGRPRAKGPPFVFAHTSDWTEVWNTGSISSSLAAA